MWRSVVYRNRQAICIVTLPGGVVVALCDSVVAIYVVVCFAWLVVLVLIWDMLNRIMSG